MAKGKLMKSHDIRKSLVTLIILPILGCLSQSTGEREASGMVGSWKENIPSLNWGGSSKQLYFWCFESSGNYQRYNVFYSQPLDTGIPNHIEWATGTWNLSGDSLWIMERKWMTYVDSMGIGKKWKVNSTAQLDTIDTYHIIRATKDSVYFTDSFGVSFIARDGMIKELENECSR
jgi:hypothetical protein